MASHFQILRLIAERPRTNIELQHLCCDHGGSIARAMSKLIAAGKAARIDGGSGRGSRATYALREAD